jgi:hypothetical protein
VVPSVLLRIDRGYFEDLLERAEPMVHYLLRLLLLRFATSARRRHAAWRQRSAVRCPPRTTPRRTRRPTCTRTPCARSRCPATSPAAVHTDQLELRYQPILHLATGGLAGCEALVRWQHPAPGPHRPGRVHPAGRAQPPHPPHRGWVLKRALDDWPALRARCRPAPASAPS